VQNGENFFRDTAKLLFAPKTSSKSGRDLLFAQKIDSKIGKNLIFLENALFDQNFDKIADSLTKNGI